MGDLGLVSGSALLTPYVPLGNSPICFGLMSTQRHYFIWFSQPCVRCQYYCPLLINEEIYGPRSGVTFRGSHRQQQDQHLALPPPSPNKTSTSRSYLET